MEKRIVLLHGWRAESGKLKPLALALQSLGWQVENLDLPGFGLPNPQVGWGVADYADYVANQAKRKFSNGNYVVFGHSFGGRVAIKLAARNLANLQGMVLCAPGGLSRPNSIKRTFFAGAARIGKTFGLAKYGWLLHKLAGEHDYEKTSGGMRETFLKVIAEDLRQILPQIRIPTLVLWGKQDRIVPYQDGELARDEISRSQLRLFDGYGHRLPYEVPEEIAKEVDRWFSSLT